MVVMALDRESLCAALRFGLALHGIIGLSKLCLDQVLLCGKGLHDRRVLLFGGLVRAFQLVLQDREILRRNRLHALQLGRNVRLLLGFRPFQEPGVFPGVGRVLLLLLGSV